jgi:hypothetical protein
MKYLAALLLLIFTAGCNTKKEKCHFSTVADLDRLDLRECPPGNMYTHDTIYYHYIRKFSSGWDSIRQARGIPRLPKDFQVITWSVDNQVRWRNAEEVKKTALDNNYRMPFMERKDLEWKSDTLIYDRSSFEANDSLDSWVGIWYQRISSTGNYVFEYSYANKTMTGIVKTISKVQADSILKAWRIDY